MGILQTVNAEHLIAYAERIELHAAESCHGKKLLEQMMIAHTLRRAAETKSLSTRREILRNGGFVIRARRKLQVV